MANPNLPRCNTSSRAIPPHRREFHRPAPTCTGRPGPPCAHPVPHAREAILQWRCWAGAPCPRRAVPPGWTPLVMPFVTPFVTPCLCPGSKALCCLQQAELSAVAATGEATARVWPGVWLRLCRRVVPLPCRGAPSRLNSRLPAPPGATALRWAMASSTTQHAEGLVLHAAAARGDLALLQRRRWLRKLFINWRDAEGR